MSQILYLQLPVRFGIIRAVVGIISLVVVDLKRCYRNGQNE